MDPRESSELMLDAPIAPPRRYSIDYYDAPNFLGPRLRIRLNGVEQRQVIEYDCDAGLVVKDKLDEDGNIILNPTRDEIVRETLHGKVTVEFLEPQP